jgi:hypothetical protein
VRQQLREQQQSVELLRADSEDAETIQAELDESKREIDRLKEERDAALGWLNQASAASAAPAAAPEPPTELVELVRHMQREIEALRAGAAEPANGETDRPRKRRRKSPEVEPPPRKPALAADRSERSRWHVRFHDLSGRARMIGGTSEEIRDWVKQGLLDPSSAQVARSEDGPFDPIGHIEEFEDLIRRPPPQQPAEPPIPPFAQPPRAARRNLLPAPERDHSRGEANDGTEKAAAPSSRASEWAMWAITILLAVVAAVLVGQRLFW